MTTEVWTPHFSQRRDLIAAVDGGIVAAVGGDSAGGAAGAAWSLVGADWSGRVRWSRPLDDAPRQVCAADDGAALVLFGDHVGCWGPDGEPRESLWLAFDAVRIVVGPGARLLAGIDLPGNAIHLVDGSDGDDAGSTLASWEGPDSTNRVHALAWEGRGVWWADYGQLVHVAADETRRVSLDTTGICGLVVTADGLLVADAEQRRVLQVDGQGEIRTRASFDAPLYAMAAHGNRFVVATFVEERARLMVGRRTIEIGGLPQGLAMGPDAVAAVVDGELVTWPL